LDTVLGYFDSDSDGWSVYHGPKQTVAGGIESG